MKLRSAALAIALCLAAATPALGLRLDSSADSQPAYVAEILLIWEMTDETRNYLSTLKDRAGQVFSDLAGNFPRGAKFGFATFADKPKLGFGYSSDKCYKTVVPLTTDRNALVNAINKLTTPYGGGGDYQHSQLDALYFGAASSKVGWSQGEFDANGDPILRIVMMMTNSLFHTAWQGSRGGRLGLAAFQDKGEDQCKNYNYPSIANIHDAYESRNAHTIFLLGPDAELRKYQQLRTDVSKTLKRSDGSGYRAGSIEGVQRNAQNIRTRVQAAVKKLLDKLPAPKRDPTTSSLSASGGNVATEYLPNGKIGEVLFVWEVSSKFSGALEKLKTSASSLLSGVASKFPGGVKVGFATFSDKPVSPFGSPTSDDHCFETIAPLTFNHDIVVDKIKKLKVANGGDGKNSQLDALYYAGTSGSVGWKEGTRGSGNRLMHRIVVMVTDSQYHTPADGKPRLPDFKDHGEGQCGSYTYADFNRIRDAFAAKHIHTIFLLGDVAQSNYWGLRSGVSKTLTGSNGQQFRAAPIKELQPGAADIVTLAASAVDHVLSKIESEGVA